jgi:uncharacterized delta-60 repeat protein
MKLPSLTGISRLGTRVAAFTSLAGAPFIETRKTALSIFCVAVLLAGGAAVARGQSALDGFDPNANNGVYVIVVQPDGKILISGQFTKLSPNGGAAVPRNYIARLNPDGTLDTAFDPNANNIVYAIAVQPDGKILVGGFFTSIGGQTRSKIARLDAVTGLADSWNPSASAAVYSIVVQADGQILAGGHFTGIGGQTRNFLARLDAGTGLADSWNPNANGDDYTIAVQADGKILAGGVFTNAGGQTRINIARLDATTGLADSWNPNLQLDSNFVLTIAVQADDKILVGGAFSNAGGQTRNNIARFDATTGAADSWNPNANAQVQTIAVQADGKILVGGLFNGTNSIGGQTRNRIARIDATTGAADSLDPNVNNVNNTAEVDVIAVQADGKILFGGLFTTVAPNGGATVTRDRMARLGILKILSISRPPNGHIVLQCLGVPNQVNDLQVSADLSAGIFAPISPPPPAADGTGAFTYDDAGAVGPTKRFYRLATP